MQTFFIVFVVLALVIAAMAVGVILGRSPIKGSCGGVANLMGEDCQFCSLKDRCEILKKACAKEKC
jgi:uncharacterized protein